MRFRRHTAIWLLIFILIPLSGIAKQYAPSYEQQRKIYKKALRDLDNEVSDQTLASALAGYPLYPYFHLESLYRQGALTQEQVDAFKLSYSGQPVIALLDNYWLAHLSKQETSDQFLAKYAQLEKPNTDAQCLYAEVLFREGDVEKAATIAAEKWNVPYSQSEVCDPLFSLWMDAKGRPYSLAWKRYVKAVRGRQDKIANYLYKYYLGKTSRQYADLFQAVFKNPLAIKNLDFNANSYINKEIYYYGMRQSIDHDLNYIIEVVDQEKTKALLTLRQIKNIKRLIAYSKIRRGHDDALTWLDNVEVNKKTLRYQQKKIQYFLRQQQWSQVKTLVQALPAAESKKPQWQYWLARAMSMTDEKESAQTIFKKLAKRSNYYGFLSAEQLNQDYRIVYGGRSATKELLNRLSRMPGLERAYELYQLGQVKQARKEWYFVLNQLSREEQRAAGVLAYKWNMPELAIRTSLRSRSPHIRPLFPLSYRSFYKKFAEELYLDEPWLYAITRQESVFDHKVVSPVNARGLMQLLPATAKETAEKFNVGFKGEHTLFRPSMNIELGSRYLRSLLDQFANHRVLATASYNAGPHRVENWLKFAEGGLPSDIWVELIPFDETRKYVKYVLGYSVIYQRRLGRDSLALFYEHEKNVILDNINTLEPTESIPEAPIDVEQIFLSSSTVADAVKAESSQVIQPENAPEPIVEPAPSAEIPNPQGIESTPLPEAQVEPVDQQVASEPQEQSLE